MQHTTGVTTMLTGDKGSYLFCTDKLDGHGWSKTMIDVTSRHLLAAQRVQPKSERVDQECSTNTVLLAVAPVERPVRRPASW